MYHPRPSVCTAILSASLWLMTSICSVAAPWEQPYQGEEATRPGIIALWQFDSPTPLEDFSGHGHTLELRGESRIVEQGRFGSCLECFSANQQNDRPQGAIVKSSRNLSPPGPFTIEMWIKPKQELWSQSTAFLLDKKYYHYPKDLPQANHDYCLYLRQNRSGQFRLVAYLGFGQDSAEFSSNPLELSPQQWTHIAFVYDGNGTGRFFVNGAPAGKTLREGRKSISPGSFDLVIGDRYGSIHAGFPGFIDQVRICSFIVPYFSGGLCLELAPDARTSFIRLEENAAVDFHIFNDTTEQLNNLEVRGQFVGKVLSYRVPSLAAGKQFSLSVPVDTRLRPGTYKLQLTAKGQARTLTKQASASVDVTIVPRRLSQHMPVVMWGTGDLDQVQQLGFTAQLVHLEDYQLVWNAGKAVPIKDPEFLREKCTLLNEYLARGIDAVVYLYPGRWVMLNDELRERFQRIDRKGKPYQKANACGLFPELRQFCYNVGASVAMTYGKFPALKAALIHSEIRDGTQLCFHPHDKEAFYKHAGMEIPAEAVTKWGVDYRKLANFPEDRVILYDHPLLVYYRWFWTDGDGWNGLHTAVHQGLKSTGRTDIWTFFDPAVRVPSIWGNGGQVDVISQWTYTYPDPIKIGQATDELLAMAEGRKDQQQVMKMTQIIWYRSQTAPELPAREEERADWEKRLPDAKFITIAPDHLREAFWCKIARPIKGIMYHGWGSLVESHHGSYRYTNPQSKFVLAELIRNVLRPLGPTLLKLSDRPADVWLLESFTSQMFAGRGTYGWGRSWEADVHLILQWARLQPRIVYEETLLRDGLDKCRILVLPYCDVLPKKVVQQIRAFQERGGIVVADEFLCPALKADILLPCYRRTGRADVDKQSLLALAGKLRDQLAPQYEWYADSSTPELVVRTRYFANADYVFVVNDRRTFGNYVGHHKLVMEKGLPTSGTLSIPGQDRQVYDLVAHRRVERWNSSGKTHWKVHLAGGEGRVFLVCEDSIEGVRIDAPESVRLNSELAVTVTIINTAGKPVNAVIPLEIAVIDPSGQKCEGTDYYAAVSGSVTVPLYVGPNDKPGKWKIFARELASGKQAEVTIDVLPPQKTATR